MKRVKGALLLVFLMVILGAGSSYAQMCGCMDKMEKGMQHGTHMGGEMGHHGMEGMRGEEHPMWKHLMGLGLDEKQKEAVKAIRSKEMKGMIKKRADKQIAKVELKEILAKDPVDMRAVEAKLKQIEVIETDMRLAHINTMEEVKALLTPDQKKRMKEMIEMGPMRGGMDMMRGCGMMGGGMQRGGMEMSPSPEKQPTMEHTRH
ncbi:MAG TPA: Spy/CpxP family protein refolding chaperone [Thermodesulfovibrionales bacterium]|nr:Spy/CpxP family protein refolding chaperone [Thermodesulfovibrionales bacterium]